MRAGFVATREFARLFDQDSFLAGRAKFRRFVVDGEPAIGISIAAIEGTAALGRILLHELTLLAGRTRHSS